MINTKGEWIYTNAEIAYELGLSPATVYCPLLLASDAISDPKGRICRRENCAWWVEDKQKCAIAVGGERNRGK